MAEESSPAGTELKIAVFYEKMSSLTSLQSLQKKLFSE